jgi:predicted DNA-binding transcriptional regulator YafY
LYISNITFKLHFSQQQAPYVVTKPIHPSQVNKPITENGVTITINVIPNYELKSLLLSFGKEVEIISPTWLKAEIIKMAYSQ